MAYSPRPDGLYNVTLDNGARVPMGLNERQLRSAGQTPAPQGAQPPAGGYGARMGNSGAGLGGSAPPAGGMQAYQMAQYGRGAPPPPAAPAGPLGGRMGGALSGVTRGSSLGGTVSPSGGMQAYQRSPYEQQAAMFRALGGRR